MANINQFKANLVGAGPRNNRFEVFIPRAGNKIQFLCKTATLPGQQIEAQEIKYKGLTIKLAGDRTFENWTVGVYNDTDFSVRSGIEEWMQEELTPAVRATETLSEAGKFLERLPVLIAEMSDTVENLSRKGIRLHQNTLDAMFNTNKQKSNWRWWVGFLFVLGILFALLWL